MVVTPKLPDLRGLRSRVSMTMHARLGDLETLCDPPSSTLQPQESGTLEGIFKELAFLTQAEETLRTMLLRFGKGEAYCPRCMTASHFEKADEDSRSYSCPNEECKSVFIVANETVQGDEEE